MRARTSQSLVFVTCGSGRSSGTDRGLLRGLGRSVANVLALSSEVAARFLREFAQRRAGRREGLGGRGAGSAVRANGGAERAITRGDTSPPP